MFRYFRDVLKALQAVALAVNKVVDRLEDLITGGTTDPSLEGRVSDLERTISMQFAEAEALMTKAKGKFDAARAAEERARRLANAAASDEDGDDEDDLFEAYAAAAAEHVRNGDAETGPEEGVHAVPSRMGSRRETREALRRAKFGY